MTDDRGGSLRSHRSAPARTRSSAPDRRAAVSATLARQFSGAGGLRTAARHRPWVITSAYRDRAWHQVGRHYPLSYQGPARCASDSGPLARAMHERASWLRRANKKARFAQRAEPCDHEHHPNHRNQQAKASLTPARIVDHAERYRRHRYGTLSIITASSARVMPLWRPS